MPDPELQDNSLETLIRMGFSHLMTDFRVALPGTVERVISGKTRLVDVRPMISVRYYEAEGVTDLPIIQRVPLVEPRTKSAFISLPVSKGDPVLMVFGDRALENWIKSDGAVPVEPLDTRSHDLTDAFAILGGWPESMSGNRPGANPDDLDIQVESGVKILIGNGTDELLQLAHDSFTALKDTLAAIQLLTVLGVTTGGGVSGLPVNAATFATLETAVGDAITSLGKIKK